LCCRPSCRIRHWHTKGNGIIEYGETSDEELRQASQTPMADLISFPIRNNTNYDYGPLKKTQNITNLQPVSSFGLSDDSNLITRTVMPMINQAEFFQLIPESCMKIDAKLVNT